MNLLGRLLWQLLFARFRSEVPPLGPARTPFRVWPTDLDLLLHMNNGVYLSILDLARMDLMMRSGVAKKIQKRGWYPVVAAEAIRFRRSMRAFQKFEVETSVVHWDDKSIFLYQRFLSGPDEVANAVIRARFLKKSGGRVPPYELMRLAGVPLQPPPAPDWIMKTVEGMAALP